MALITREMRQAELKADRDFSDQMKKRDDAAFKAKSKADSLKQQILLGSNYREVYDIDSCTQLEVRPITDAEYMEVKLLISRGLKVKREDGSIEEIVRNQKEAEYTAVAYALSVNGEKWTAQEVGLLPPNVPKILYEIVSRISGFTRGEGTPNR